MPLMQNIVGVLNGNNIYFSRGSSYLIKIHIGNTNVKDFSFLLHFSQCSDRVCIRYSIVGTMQLVKIYTFQSQSPQATFKARF